MSYRLIALLLACLAQAASAADTASALVDSLAGFRFGELGNPQIQTDSLPPVLAAADRPQRLLILPVAFPDVGFERFAGDPQQERRNRAYFEDLLFAGGVEHPRPGTLSHYYRHQSRGRYNITGDVFPTVQLDRPLSYYGRPVQSTDGSWRSDERDTELVKDAVRAAYRAHPDFPWRDYDLWDPHDFDGDGNRDEPDGYLDHLIIVNAGKGQAFCQGLYNLDQKLNENSPGDAVDALTPAELACADRVWPHRGYLLGNLGRGPSVGGIENPRGGIDIGNGLWLTDYNIQPEYTDAGTFIHEFGHSLGLPDIYAAATNNSTASWDAMSNTVDPLPQELSSWSRMVLGWLRPCVVRPPDFGGATAGTLQMKVMNDWSAPTPAGQCDAAMVILPPKFRDIDVGPLAPANGRQAVYTGQGNDVRRSLSRSFDFRGVPAATPLILTLDTWFEIEAEWDYLYVEAAVDGGDFVRLLPMDKDSPTDPVSVMPAAKGHEGQGSLPGFTGRSGDRDGDGKVESSPGCDPAATRVLAEDRLSGAAAAPDPCTQAQWVSASFDLEALRGHRATLRFTYFTDGATVENGALLDNITIGAIDFQDSFEGPDTDGWVNDGFTLSGGHHHLPVPHFYLLEFRDPYAEFDAATNYDRYLTEPAFLFYPGADGHMQALNVNYRPGLLLWYYDGEYLWSQNEPSELGVGNGFLLVVDANPQEFPLPALPDRYFDADEEGWTAWSLPEAAQPLLASGFLETMCFERRPAYYSGDVPAVERDRCADAAPNGVPPLESLRWQGRDLMYGYTINNELLPGAAREARQAASSLYDLRLREGRTEYRLNDRALRDFHSADAPFALAPFPTGVEIYEARDGALARVSATPFPPVSRFDDRPPNRYQNPRLPFGGATIPHAGFSFELLPPGATSPPGTRVQVAYRWQDLAAAAGQAAE